MARCMACLEQVEEVETVKFTVGNKTHLYQICAACRQTVTDRKIRERLETKDEDRNRNAGS